MTDHTDNGSVEIATPRDRNSTFDPKFIAKRQRSLKGFDDKIISMYARGMTMKEIKSHIEEIWILTFIFGYTDRIYWVKTKVKLRNSGSVEEIKIIHG